jgi:hypothetical protein
MPRGRLPFFGRQLDPRRFFTERAPVEQAVYHRPVARLGTLAPLLLVVLLFGSLCIASPDSTHVQSVASSRLRAVVWLGRGTEGLLDRIQGQTHDLGVDLVVESTEPLPSDRGAQLRVARRLTERLDASVVMWFMPRGVNRNDLLVRIALPRSSRLLERDLGTIDPDANRIGLSSAALEAAALVVRAAIQALLAGTTIGVENVGRFDNASSTKKLDPASGMPAIANSPARQEPVEPPRPTRLRESRPLDKPRPAQLSGARAAVPGWVFAVRGLLLDDGTTDYAVAECLAIRVGRNESSVDMFLAGSSCLPRDVANPYGTIRIARQQVVIGSNLFLFRAALWGSVGIHAGVTMYGRRTLSEADGVSGREPQTYTLATAGPELRLQLPASSSHVCAELALGVDFNSRSLQMGYLLPGYQQVTDIAPIQPYLALGFQVQP